MLTVIQHQQQPFIPEHAQLQTRAAQGGRHLLGHKPGISEGSQFHQPGPISETASELVSDPQRQPRLARPARPGQGEDPGS
jgi:hypothetical protein